jgi:alkanesulfonate monooxygenase SsuD/methylene tetrahydromethanopterin reductase-like flavin-dependent oxidoreductase (luciferase family)
MPETPIQGMSFLAADILGDRQVDRQSSHGSVRNIPEFLELGKALSPTFRRLWLTDNLGYRSTQVMLALAARELPMHLGHFTAFPYGRNPIDIAATASSIAELMNGRELVLGLSRGNRIISRTFTPHRPVAALRETLLFIRRLHAGETVPLGEFPVLQEICGFRDDGVARLYMEPQQVPLFIGTTGPKTMALAGEVADGAFFATQQPNQSLEAMRRGIYDSVSGISELREARATSTIDSFGLVNGISVCVSEDATAAREFARREVAGIVGSKSEAALDSIGVDLEAATMIRRAFDEGAGFGGASRYVNDEMVDLLVISGTPADVVPKILEASEFSTGAGFTEQFLGLPLGPDLRQAVRLIIDRVMPELS